MSSVTAEEAGKVRKGNQRPDIIIDDGLLPPVIIETSYSGADADNDARKRLGAKLVDSLCTVHTCVALHIPEEMKNVPDYEIVDKLNGGAKLRYAVHRAENRGGGVDGHTRAS